MKTRIAKRYADALSVSARNHGQTADVLSQLKGLAALWQDSAELRETMNSPRVGQSAKAEILQTLAKRMKLSPIVASLLELLLDRGRLGSLPALLEEFEAMEDRKADRIKARCSSAHPLSDQQAEQLRQTLIRVSGASDVLLALETDPSLLAGFTLSFDGKIIDGSLRGRLRRLQSSLAP